MDYGIFPNITSRELYMGNNVIKHRLRSITSHPDLRVSPEIFYDRLTFASKNKLFLVFILYQPTYPIKLSSFIHFFAFTHSYLLIESIFTEQVLGQELC